MTRPCISVEPCDQQGHRLGGPLVALDMIGAGYGEMVLLCQGSPCRQTKLTDNRPIDVLIVAIVDLIDEGGTVVYAAKTRRHEEKRLLYC